MIEIIRPDHFRTEILQLPDGRTWSRANERILSHEIIGERVLVKTSGPPGRVHWAAIALDREAFLAAHPQYRGVSNAAATMAADVREHTKISISPDVLEAFVTPTNALCRVPSIPFSIVEVDGAFAVMLRLTRPKEHPRNVYMFETNGTLQWRIGRTPDGREPWFSSMRVDERGRLIVGWDIKIPNAWNVEPGTGALTDMVPNAP